jgi:glycosyltransferase involved in cell wall biosynthesis
MTASICVAICTHNRAAYLRRALDSLRAQDVPTQLFDALVVDNASIDDTKAVVQAHADGMPNLRYVYEPRIGLSHARNRATEESRSDLIAFLDDDAIADPHWVSALLAAFQGSTPTPACVGGRVELIWEAPRPAWLPEELLGYLSQVSGAHAMAINPFTQTLAGANIAFSTSKLRAVNGFDARLGRVGRNLVSGEELLAQRRLYQGGHFVLYEPKALVHHHVPASRLERNWFYRRVFAQGVTEATMDRVLQSSRSRREVLRALSILFGTVATPRLLAGLVWPGVDAKSVARKCKALKQLGLARGQLLRDAAGNRVGEVHAAGATVLSAQPQAPGDTSAGL